MKKLLLFLLFATAAFGQENYNINVGGLPFTSGSSVPGSCPRDGAFFWKNATTKGWYQCVAGAYVAFGSGGGSVTSGTLTNNTITKATGAAAIANSLATDDGTTLTYTGTGGISAASITTTGTTTQDRFTEMAAPTTPNAGFGYAWFDSTNHRFNECNSSATCGTTVVAITAPSHQFFNSITAAGGVVGSAAIVAGDLPATLTSGTAITNAALTTPTLTGAVTKTGQNCIVAATAAIADTDTLVVQTPAALAANRLVAGTHIRATLSGSFTAGGAASPVWRMHIGTAGTVSDTAAYAVTGPASVTGTATFQVVLEKTIRVPSGTATSWDTYRHANGGVVGLAATVSNTNNQTGVAFDSTAADFITVSFKSGNASNNATFQDACIEITNN